MSLATVYTLKNANFSGKGLPNIFPFIDKASLEFAYDFQNRPQRLADLVGKHADLIPYRQDIIGGVVRTIDPSMVVTTADGKGIRLELGYLRTDIPLTPIVLGGATKFTIMVVGGDSGIAFPAGKVSGSAPTIAMLFDYGTNIGDTGGFAVGDYRAPVANALRIKSGSPNVTLGKSSTSQKTVSFLTYDGAKWTLNNPTLSQVLAKTDAQLGLAGTLPVATSSVSHMVLGHYHGSSTLGANFPELYQFAKWNRVLTNEEILQQYLKTKAMFPTVGL